MNYTLRSVTSKIVQVLFLSAGLLMTGHAILTPLLIIIIMLAGDGLGMSSTTDNVRPSRQPSLWHIRNLTIAGIFMGVCELSFCVAVLAIGIYRVKLGIASLQTLAFFLVVCANQASTYSIRARGWLWSAPHPCRWLVLASAIDLSIALTLASRGCLMVALPLSVLAAVLGGAIAFTFMLDLARIPVFRRLGIS